MAIFPKLSLWRRSLCSNLGGIDPEKLYRATLKVMLHRTIRNDDFCRNTAWQCWNNVVTIQNNVAPMLQRCVALKIVAANRPV